MKNDLLIKVVFPIFAGMFGLLVSVGGYAFGQDIKSMDRRLQTVERKADETATIREAGYQRLTRVEAAVESISKSVEEIKQDARRRDEKLDRILEKVTSSNSRQLP